jgi:hypothetical protein
LGEEDNTEDDNTRTHDSDEGKDDEQQDNDKNEKLTIELTTNQISSNEETMKPAQEETWGDQENNTDDKKRRRKVLSRLESIRRNIKRSRRNSLHSNTTPYHQTSPILSDKLTYRSSNDGQHDPQCRTRKLLSRT